MRRAISGTWDWWLRMRHTLTGGSVTLLLLAIISMNIIWGYPWTGMFASCVSLFVVGFVINRLARPRLSMTLDAPRWVAAGQPATVRVRFENNHWLPAMDLRTGLEAPVQSDRSWASSPAPVLAADFPLLRPGEEATFEQPITFERRGQQPLPPLRIESLFPFHLFRHTQRIATHQHIIVAPRRLQGEADAALRQWRASLRSMLRRWIQGDSMHYVGSREYQLGVPVRRWDFASWARLGKPIYREFSTPSSQNGTLIVDTAAGRENSTTASKPRRPLLWERHRGSPEDPLERVLSLAVTAMEDWLSHGMRLDLLVTSEPPEPPEPPGPPEASLVRCLPQGDLTDAMEALATAASVPAATADDVITAMLERPRRHPTIVISGRSRPNAVSESPSFVWVNVFEDTVEAPRGSALDTVAVQP